MVKVHDKILVSQFDHQFQKLYQQYRSGEISLGWMAQELGLSVRDTYDLLEKSNLPLSAGVDRIKA